MKFDDSGVFTCLTCFNCGCETNLHASQHYNNTKHPITVRIRKRYKSSAVSPLSASASGSAPPSKVQIVEEKESDLVETLTDIYCMACRAVITNDQTEELIQKVMSATSAQQQSDIKAWEEEVIPCEHTLTIDPVPVFTEPALKCAECELTTGLWKCLICGYVGCGRRQFDGSGGNSHGLSHFQETGHCAAVKLGTITAEGNGDVFCYLCDDMRVDPFLGDHMSVLGMNIATETKTEKSMAELQLEQNLKWEFNMATEDGKTLQPIFGANLVGLKNIGNSCYMASVLESMAPISFFRRCSIGNHRAICPRASPAECDKCQLEKLSEGLTSGKYSRPTRRAPVDGPAFQDGIPPTMFKDLACRGHPDFSTMQQQDAYEFLQFLLSYLDRIEEAAKPSFDFEATLSRKLSCPNCNAVGYKEELTTGMTIPVEEYIKSEGQTVGEAKLSACVEASMVPEIIEGFTCPSCGAKVDALSTPTFVTFPKYLVMQLRRFVLDNWVPKKLNTKVHIDSEELDLTKYQGTGKPDPGEKLFPEQKKKPEDDVDESALQQLMGMGFSKNRCIRGLKATNNAGPEAAMEYLFTMMDDASLDDEIIVEAESSDSSEAPPELVSSLMDMGFSDVQAKRALYETKNNVEIAVAWLFENPDKSFEPVPAAPATRADNGPKHPVGSSKYKLHAVIAHKGTSVGCGHYVSYVRHTTQGWVLFNDEKVVRVNSDKVLDSALNSDGADLGYIYVWTNQ